MFSHKKPLSRAAAWSFLAGAVVLEVVGTTAMTLSSRENAAWGYLVMAAAIALAYMLLSQAVRVIPLGIAYAIWEGLGLLLIALISIAAFGEALSLYKIGGLLLAIVGIVLISSGESSSHVSANGAASTGASK